VSPASITVSSILDPRFTTGADVVLADRIVTLQTPGRDSTGYLPAVRRISMSVDLTRVGPIYFSGGAATVKNREVYVVMVSDSSLAPNPGFTNGALKFDFYDD